MVRRSLKDVTNTPIWLCWLVLMLPAFIWTAWTFAFGTEQPLPLAIFLFPLIICPILYGWLVQRGKPAKATTTTTQEQPNTTMAKSVQKPSPPRLIDRQEEATLRNCFPWNIYYLQNIDNRPQAIFCRGKLKTIPEKAYAEIKNNIEQAFGDRFFLIFQESFRGKPFFALVPNPQAQKELRQDNNFALAIGMFLLTLATATLAGASIGEVSPEEISDNLNLLVPGLAYSLPLMLILGVRELCNYFTANHYQIRTSLPYFIPFPSFFFDNFSLGTLGAFTQKKSPIPNRQALFDVAILGSICSFILTVVILIWGLSLSTVTTLEDSTEFSFAAFDPRMSLLLSLLAKFSLGNPLQAGMGVELHPLAAAGCIGLLFTTINLMPIGQLDGGHIAHAVFGQRTAIAIGQITRILALLFALVHPYFWIWAIVLWFIPLIDQPALNDVTQLNNWRDALGLLALALFVIAILPLPGTVAGWLSM
nr:site-2 protease family protein [Myxosarcina sp. GI1]